jgi:hypothetical protein
MIEAARSQSEESAFDELIDDEYSRPQTCYIPPVD